MRTLAALLVGITLTSGAHAQSTIDWTLQHSATAGAALIATQGTEELGRLGCLTPAELFVHTPEIKSGEHPAALQLGGLELPLTVERDSPELAGAIGLRPDIIDALLSASELRISQGPAQLALVLPDMELKGQLAEACSLMLEGASIGDGANSQDWSTRPLSKVPGWSTASTPRTTSAFC
jgi:hypothetical protein